MSVDSIVNHVSLPISCAPTKRPTRYKYSHKMLKPLNSTEFQNLHQRQFPESLSAASSEMSDDVVKRARTDITSQSSLAIIVFPLRAGMDSKKNRKFPGNRSPIESRGIVCL